MGPGLATDRHRLGRSHLPLLALVAIGVLLGSAGSPVLSGGRSNGPGLAVPHVTGATAVAEARASVAAGHGPAAVHPAALPTSPGGYTWTNVTAAVGPSPGGRITDMAWDAVDQIVLLFGWDDFAGALRDTWTYANGSWTNITGSVGTAPPVAVDSAMAYDPSTQAVVLYVPLVNATWSFHDRTWSNITATAGAPTEVAIPSFVTDSTDREAVLFGGEPVYASTNYDHETWAFKNGTWRNITASAPFNFGRILLPVGADDPTDHGIVATGIAIWANISPVLTRPATFVFSGGTWTNLTPTLTTEPAMSELFSFAWVPTIAADVMQSGGTINSTGSFSYLSGVTWEFSHGVWTNVTAVTGPQPDNGIVTAGAVDPSDGTYVLFGGERVHSPILYPSTWIFSAAPTVGASASKPVLDAGQSVVLTGTVANGVPSETYRWNFGDGSNATTLSGAHTYSKTGLVTATLTVTDLVGHTVSASTSVYVNPALSVSANATPSEAANGSWVAFASQVTGGTAPFSYSWTLGDGASSTAASFAHAYATKGNYTVNLTVTDAVGVAKSASFVVTVTHVAPAATASSSSSSSVSLTSGTGLYLLLGLLVLLVVAVLLVVLLARRPRSPPGTLQPYPTASGASPPAGASPPPGAGGPPT